MDPDHAVTRLPDYVNLPKNQQPRHQPADSSETIEERCFSASLICLEGHYTQSPPMGPKTMGKVNSMIAKTLEKTHTCRKSRYVPFHERHTLQLLLTSYQGSSLAQRSNMDMAHEDICRSHSQPNNTLGWTSI